MKAIIPAVITFSALLVIPLGYQSAFAGAGFGPSPYGPFGSPPVSIDIPFSGLGEYIFENRIIFDPDGNPQEKHFLNPVVGINSITERIYNDGNVPITDWHEEIVNYPDAEWTYATAPPDPPRLEVLDCNTGGPLPNAQINPMSNSHEIWIDFVPPILPGECFLIDKDFTVNVNLPNSRAVIIEYPTADLDFGDLPDAPHPTLLASDGARHVITGLKMGPTIDAEPDGQPDPAASLDGPDEDGLTSSALVAGSPASTVTIGSTSGAGTIHVFADKGVGLVSVGTLVVGAGGPHVVPADMTGASAGPIDLRIRFCSTGDCGSPMGGSFSGEVEDYVLMVTGPGGPNPVGGTGIPISTTSLALAGLQSNFSVLMALTAVSFGAFGFLYYSTRKKSEETLD